MANICVSMQRDVNSDIRHQHRKNKIAQQKKPAVKVTPPPKGEELQGGGDFKWWGGGYIGLFPLQECRPEAQGVQRCGIAFSATSLSRRQIFFQRHFESIQ